ncbi:NDR1/HIN1-like 8 [Zea mays]|uniref:NDR1/HIN1-like 8 n=1 Tax=Zea mays TaxID=4577 RepID=A0A1D6HGL4_MAIZE|nr:NDR1/HIN1-like 8 [Zea mays]
MSSGATSSSSPPLAEAGDGYWEGREEAVARLKAMAARAHWEDELSAERLETNNQVQEDEMLALQAIYGDDMVILEDKAGFRSFQIFVWYPIPNGTKVFLNLHPNGTMVGTDNDESKDGGELIYACSLKHLPPVEKHQKYSLPEKQLLKEQREIDELISVCEALRDSKQCPSCKMAISKTEGCNKMICRNCGKFFCYRCNQAIRGYEHFWDGNCVLFEHQNQVQIYGRLEESDDEEHFDDEDLEETEPELVWGCPCPVCGRWNGKLDTNNHILCMGCRGHYCALCRRRVMKSSEHYGPRGCQQHTDP